MYNTTEPPSKRHKPNHRLRLGLCCLNKTLRSSNPTVFTNRTMRLKTLKEKGNKLAVEYAIKNLNDLEKLIHWNHNHNINVFRLSSEIFPHMSNPEIHFYGFHHFESQLEKIGNLAKKYNQRLTFHPGQFNVVGSNNKQTVEKTIRELDQHAKILDIMNQDENGIMVVHGGGVYNDKPKTMERWVENFGLLSESAKKRLVLENCEKSYTVRDCLTISSMIFKKYGFYLPIVIDSHHYTCYGKIHPENIQEPIDKLLPEVWNTWKSRNIRPKFHVSEQGDGRIGHHSDYVEKIPDYMIHFPNVFCSDLDIMIEAKHKELAIAHLYKLYPALVDKL